MIILNFILFSFAILLLLIFLGIGIAILVLPHDKLKYSLFFAPFFGLSYGTFIGWIFFVNSIGTDRYVYATLIIPFIALIVGIYLRKKDINEVFRPFHKKNLILLGICACLFLFISLPYSTLPEFSTITLGNNDIIDYAFVSKFLMQPDFHSAPQVVFERNNYMLTNQYFSAYFVGSYSASLFGVEAYSLENILNYLFFILILPFIYLIAHEIFRCKNKVALLITFLVGLNFNLIFITYQGFLGQLIGTGFFLGISFLMLDGMENRPLFSQTKLYPALAIMVYGLVMSYCTLVPIIFIPFFVGVMAFCIIKRDLKSVVYLFFGTGIIFTIITLFSSGSILPRLNALITLQNAIVGYSFPPMAEDWILGVFGFIHTYDGNIFWDTPLPGLLRFIIITFVIIATIFSLICIKKKNFRLFTVIISYLVIIGIFYLYLLFQEFESKGVFTGEGYKAYKLLTYFIPLAVVTCLTFLGQIENYYPGREKILTYFSYLFICILICGNVVSSVSLVYTQINIGKSIDSSIIELKRSPSIHDISSINIPETDLWTQMWLYYFLAFDHRVYLNKSVYYPSEQMTGEWTLFHSTNFDNSGFICKPVKDKEIVVNSNYCLVKGNSTT